MNVTNSTISGNRVTSVAFTGDGGAGIADYYSTLGVIQSTVSGNTVAASTPVAGTGGGGIVNKGGTLNLTNSTISGNQSAVDGGGVENAVGDSSSTVVFTNVTVYGNSAQGKGGSVNNDNDGGSNVVTIANTIFAGGSAPTGAEVANGDTFVSNGGNLIQGAVSGSAIPPASNGIADLLGVSPALASGLASNGGATQTIADTSSSPGKAHIPFSGGVCGYSGPAIDQRGFTRGAGGFCDIGAYEFSGTGGLP